MAKISIQAEVCQKCGLCVEICPEGLFRRSAKRAVPRILHPSACTVCGHCVSVCPSGAILHADFPPEDWLKPGDR